MLILMRCLTCGKPLANIEEEYNKLVLKYSNEQKSLDAPINLVHISKNMVEKTPQAKAMDELNIKRYCCRTAMLSNQVIAYDLSNKASQQV